jgi:hypothetical protein
MKNDSTALRSAWLAITLVALAALPHQAAWGACSSTVTTGTGTPLAHPHSHGIKENGNIAGQTFKAPGSGCIALESVTFSIQKHKPGGGGFGNLTVTVYTTTGSPAQPNAAVAGASATVLESDVQFLETLTDVTATFSPPVSLAGGSTYAVIVSSPTTTGSAHWELGLLDASYADGQYWKNDGTTGWASPVDGSKDAKMTLCFVACPSGGCTLTQGYWKNHPDAWPVSSLNLGSVLYTKAELLSILGTPVGGNGLISLAYQLIAAKLNIANGADGSAVTATITAADTLIGSLVIPPVGSDYLSPAATGALTTALDDYNNGVTGPGHCPE